jgi:hypothetical protein
MEETAFLALQDFFAFACIKLEQLCRSSAIDAFALLFLSSFVHQFATRTYVVFLVIKQFPQKHYKPIQKIKESQSLGGLSAYDERRPYHK